MTCYPGLSPISVMSSPTLSVGRMASLLLLGLCVIALVAAAPPPPPRRHGGGGGGGGGDNDGYSPPPPPPPPPPPAAYPPPPPCTWGSWSIWSGTCQQTQLEYCSLPLGCKGGCEGGFHVNSRDLTQSGTWTGWSQWTQWTTTCGSGTRTSTRTCANQPASCSSNCPGSSTRSQSSDIIGAVANWAPWSSWSASCGINVIATRACIQQCGATFGCTGAGTRTATFCCPYDTTWSQWTAGLWSSTCGAATRTLTRTCQYPANACIQTCSGSSTSSESNCCVGAVQGVWSGWSPWAASCVSQTGTTSRTRTCSARCGGTACPGATVQTGSIGDGVTCCGVNPTWSSWTAWTTWSTTCGDAAASRSRVCSYPPGLDLRCYGPTCPGLSTETRARTNFNAVSGGWTAWGAWSATCGSAIFQSRSCTAPLPACGGSACAGLSMKSAAVCCPAAATWGAWGPWAAWTGSCGSARASQRTRVCGTTCGSPVCSGSSTDSRSSPAYLNCCANFFGTAEAGCQACLQCAGGLSQATACSATANTVCRDLTKPVVTLLGSSTQTQQAGQPWTNPGATATDAVDGPIATIAMSPPTGVDVYRLGAQNITYSATDAAGNTGTAVRTVTVIDTLPPAITLLGASVMTWLLNTPFTDPGCSAVDQLDSTVNCTVQGVVNVAVAGNNTLNYTACDRRAPPNCAWAVRIVTILSTQVPLVSLKGPATAYVEAPGSYTDPGVTILSPNAPAFLKTATVFLGSAGQQTVSGINGTVLGTYLITYSVNNTYGVAPALVRTVVVRVTVPPVITLSGSSDLSLQGGDRYIEPGYSAVSGYYGILTSQVVVQGNNFNVFAPAGTVFTIWYTVTDPSNNTASTSRSVRIIDTLAPSIYLIGNATYFQQANATFVDPGAYANDTLDGVLTSRIVVSGTVNVNGPYLAQSVLTYSVADAAGNTNTIQRTVVIVNYIRPVITLNGGDMSWEAANPFRDPGATAWDVLDGNLTGLISVAGTVNVNSSSGSSYTLTYTVTDTAGLVAVPKTRTVTVIDTTLPVITLLGNATYYQEATLPYIDPGATAWDSLQGNITPLIFVNNPVVIPSPAGTVFTVAYNVRDAAGNSAVQVTRTVIIVQTFPPNITLFGGRDVTLQGGSPWIEPGYAAVDPLDGVITANVSIVGSVNTSAPAGTVFTLTYKVIDSAGNRVSVQRKVTIVDLDAPSITLYGEAAMWWESAVNWTDPGYYASDMLDGDLTSQVVITGSVNVWAASGSNFTLAYNVRDRAGNSAATRTRLVTMLDTIAPVLTVVGGNVVEHEAAVAWVDPGCLAWDNLDRNLTRNVTTFGDSLVNVSAPSGTRFNVTYACVDAAGNHAEAMRIIFNVDTTKPVMTLNGPAFAQQQATLPYHDPGATAWDTLEGNLTSRITVTGSVNVYAPAGTNFTLTYTVSDRAGNMAVTLIRVVQIIDTIAPNLTLVGPDALTYQGGVPYVDLGALSTDLLNGDLTSNITVNVSLWIPASALYRSQLQPAYLALNGNLSIVSTFAPLGSVYHIVYTSVDAAGNVATVARNVTIVNKLGPTLALLGDPSIRIRQGSLYHDSGAIAISQYFGNLTNLITQSVSASTLANLGSAVGTFTLTYACRDPTGFSAVPVSRVVQVMASAAQLSDLNTYSEVSMTFEMTVTTPRMDLTPVAYKATLTPVSMATNITALLLQAGITPTFLSCGNLSCAFEAQTLSTQSLQLLRANNKTASVSWVPLPILAYSGAFNTKPAGVTLSSADASTLLLAYGYQAENVTCAQGVCTFSTANRLTASTPLRQNARRAAPTTAQIDQLFLAPSPSPYLKRAVQITIGSQVQAAQVGAVSQQAIRLVGMQPIDIACTTTSCVVQTYDPVQQLQMTQIASLLPPGAVVSPPTYFSSTRVDMPNPAPNSTDATLVQLLALQQGIAPYRSACSALSCSLWTYAVVQQAQADGLAAVLNGPVTTARLNESAAVNLPYGQYFASISIMAGTDPATVLVSCGIVYWGLSCFASLSYDNVVDCTYFVEQQLTGYQLFNLDFLDEVVNFDESSPVTLSPFFTASLQRTLAEIAEIPSDRLFISSFDATSGAAVVQVYPVQTNDPSVLNANVTLWAGAYSVDMYSISLVNATALLRQAGIVPVSVVVHASAVDYVAVNVTTAMLAALRNLTSVVPASVVQPVPTQGALSHEEVARLYLFQADNNMLTVDVSDRTFWAIPKSGAAVVVPFGSSPSSADSSSGPDVGLIVGILIACIVGGALVVYLAVMIVARRRRAATKSNPIHLMTEGHSSTTFHCDNPAFVPASSMSGPNLAHDYADATYRIGSASYAQVDGDYHTPTFYGLSDPAAGSDYGPREFYGISATGGYAAASSTHGYTQPADSPYALGDGYAQPSDSPYALGDGYTQPGDGMYAIGADGGYAVAGASPYAMAGGYQEPGEPGYKELPGVPLGAAAGYSELPAPGGESGYRELPVPGVESGYRELLPGQASLYAMGATAYQELPGQTSLYAMGASAYQELNPGYSELPSGADRPYYTAPSSYSELPVATPAQSSYATVAHKSDNNGGYVAGSMRYDNSLYDSSNAMAQDGTHYARAVVSAGSQYALASVDPSAAPAEYTIASADVGAPAWAIPAAPGKVPAALGKIPPSPSAGAPVPDRRDYFDVDVPSSGAAAATAPRRHDYVMVVSGTGESTTDPTKE
eukprot:m.39384 g.39384  ORF g.39384 m.39384 type:complete len:2683 (+) comp5560_c0_seq2:3-8051(+)